MKQDYIASLVSPYIDKQGKPRLIEPPKQDLKDIQTRIKKLLGKIVVPDNIFSGVKGRSYADNALMHIGDKRRNLYKIDLTAFFPSIKRETVYKFFLEELRCSPDVARMLTDFTTIDLEKANASNIEEVYDFLKDKNVFCTNHLISGAPTSQILSYLVNHHMFDELQKLADDNNTTMTVYVDDVTFSSEDKLSAEFSRRVCKTVEKYGYQISKSKVKNYTKLYPKLVTGVIIDSKGNPTVKNSLRKKIINEYIHLKENPDDETSRNRLRGLLTAARQVDKNIFPSIYKFAFYRKEQPS